MYDEREFLKSMLRWGIFCFLVLFLIKFVEMIAVGGL